MKAFIVTYGGGHANIVKHIVPKLSKVMEVEILALTVAPQVLDRAGIGYRKLSDYAFLFKNKLDEVREYGEELTKIEYNPKAGISYDECVLYLGFGYLDMLGELQSKAAAKKCFQEKGRKAFCPKRTMKTILEYVKPDVLICTASVRYEKAAGIAANELGIKLIHIHDLVEVKPLPYDAYLCLMNDYAKKHAVESGVISPDKVYVTGQPCFEYDLMPDVAEEENTRRRLNTSKYEKVIIYLEQPFNKDIETIENFLRGQAERNRNNLYIAKLHPNQDFSEGTYVDENFIKVRKWDLKSLLRVSDIAITCDSTSGLEAVLLGKPLILVGIQNEIRADFSQYGIAIKTDSIEGLEKALKSIDSFDVKSKMEAARAQFKNKENASQNIVDTILKIVKKQTGDKTF